MYFIEAFNDLAKIHNVLKFSGLIAIPIDYLYGFVCLASNKNSIEKINKIKHELSNTNYNNFNVSVQNIDEIKK